jgi:GT2 family glycosyltransferase
MNKLIVSMVVYKTPITELSITFSYLLKNIDRINLKIYIFDNQGSKELRSFCLRNNFEYRSINKNIGFGAGHNFIFSESINYDGYYLILNPDVYLYGEKLNKILNYLESNPSIGVLSPKLLNSDGSIQHICRNFPTPFNLFLRRLLKSVKDYPDHAYDKNIFPQAIHGACLFIHSKTIKKVGGFDEKFFLYMEDIDLCRRVGKTNEIIMYSDVTAVHLHQKGSHKNLKLLILHLKSSFTYFKKWGLF